MCPPSSRRAQHTWTLSSRWHSSQRASLSVHCDGFEHSNRLLRKEYRQERCTQRSARAATDARRSVVGRHGSPSPPPKLPNDPLRPALGRALRPSLPKRHLRQPGPKSRHLQEPEEDLEPRRRLPPRLRPSPGPGRARRPSRPLPRHDPRRATPDLPRPVPRPAAIRTGDLLRPARQDRLHGQQGPDRRGPQPKSMAADSRRQGRRAPPRLGPTTSKETFVPPFDKCDRETRHGPGLRALSPSS